MKRFSMKKGLRACAVGMALIAGLSASAEDFTPRNPMTLWYDVPSTATGVKNATACGRNVGG